MASKGGIVEFLKGVRKEIEKTTWPDWEKVKKAFIAVGVVVFAYALLTGVFDALIGLFMSGVLKI